MNDSKKQLIAQINKIEEALYAEKERALQSKQQIATYKIPYFWGIVLLTSVPLLFFKSKKTIKGLAYSIVTMGKFALVSFCKKQIIGLLEKK
jgi:hypothetical protein